MSSYIVSCKRKKSFFSKRLCFFTLCFLFLIFIFWKSCENANPAHAHFLPRNGFAVRDKGYVSMSGNVALDMYGSNISVFTKYENDFEKTDIEKSAFGRFFFSEEPTDEEVEELENIVVKMEELDKIVAEYKKNDSEAEVESENEDVVLSKVSEFWIEYEIKKGETLFDVAMRNGIPMQTISRVNMISNIHKLSEKQILLVPKDEEPETIEKTLEETRTRKERILESRKIKGKVETTEHVVTLGDSLWSIANAYNLEVDTLLGSNKIPDSGIIQPGTTIRIPNKDGIFYLVKKGESITSITKEYKIEIENVKIANSSVNMSNLIAGQEIFLPGARIKTIEQPKENVKKTIDSSRSKTSSGVQVRKPLRSAARAPIKEEKRSWAMPVRGKLSSPFGWRRHPITRRRDFHTGVDLKAPRGTSIIASKAGTVQYAGWMSNYGKTVVINHGNGYSTLYAHCSNMFVSVGKRVSSGQRIAVVGTTGRTTGPHLHFEIRRNNSPINPMSVF